MAIEKRCSTCKEWKNKEDFNKSKFSKDGFHNACKQCSSKAARKASAAKHKYRIENKLCVSCGELLDNDFKRCQKCLVKVREYQSHFYQKRIDAGYCGCCGKRELVSKNGCERCLSRYHAEKETHPERRIYRAIKASAKRKGLEFNLELSDIKIPDLCPLLEIPLKIGDHKKNDGSPSVDRIDPKKGYIKGNVWIVSDKANRIKNDATPNEIFLLASNIKKFISLF